VTQSHRQKSIERRGCSEEVSIKTRPASWVLIEGARMDLAVEVAEAYTVDLKLRIRAWLHIRTRFGVMHKTIRMLWYTNIARYKLAAQLMLQYVLLMLVWLWRSNIT
jgi:hypothetical protein